MKIGYFLSCEEHTPEDLVSQAVAAEEAGFAGLWISDHITPWNSAQGQSPMVWPVIGAVAQATDLPVMTAVTCPIGRTGPLVVAHAAATCAVMNPGFRLGVGTGEALNEHLTGEVWPSFDVRVAMLEEAVALIRELCTGRTVDHRGEFFTIDDARLWTVPEEPLPIWMSAFGEKATRTAAELADGFVSTTPDAELRGLFSELSGGKPSAAGLKVAWAPTPEEGVEHAHRLWANAGLPGELAQVLPSPYHFEQASQLVTKEATAESIVAGRDAEEHAQAVEEYADAGFDEVYVGNIGPHWREMIAFYGEHVIPRHS